VKLHDLKPAAGSRKHRTRVGRGIAAGKGKTAGRGTKGQKSRAGASIPAWFEGGQTPIHIRLPKLRGFKRRFRIEYQVVNVGRLAEYAAAGRFGVELEPAAQPRRGKSAEQQVVTVNAEVLASAGLIRSTRRPVKVLGQGDIEQKLFVLADAFTASARQKIEGAGGFVQLVAPTEEEAPRVAGGAAEPTPATADAEPSATAAQAEVIQPTAADLPPVEEAEPPPAEGTEPPPARKPRRKAERQE